MSKLRNLIIVSAVLSFAATSYAATHNTQNLQAAGSVTAISAKANSGKKLVKSHKVKKSKKTHKTKSNVIMEKININTADAKEFAKVKGISVKKAAAIVKYRDSQGEFKSVDALLKVKCRGINSKWLKKVAKHLTI